MLKAGTSIISSLKRVLCREADDVDFKEKQLILSFYDRSRLRQFKQVIGKSRQTEIIIYQLGISQF